MILALVSTLHAVEPPPRPAAPAAVPGECARAYPIEAGKALPASLLDARGLPACGGVLLPSSDMADLLATEVWGKEVAQRYTVDTASLQAQLATEREQKEWWRKQAERKRPEPVVLVGGGVILGVGLTVLAGWAVGQAAPDVAPALPF